MRAPQVPSDPTDINALGHYLKQGDPDGRLGALGLSQLMISNRAHLDVAEVVSQALKDGHGQSPHTVVILYDKTDIRRDGQDLKKAVTDELATRFSVNSCVLGDEVTELHASEKVLDTATAAIAKAEVVVTVGSGTITDVGKVACSRHDNKPLVAVQTAASVDGFTDDVSVVLRQGVKRTISSCWPYAVLADTVTIADAPSRLNEAGFGEALSMFTAPADWYLSSLVGLDTTFHQSVCDVFVHYGHKSLAWSAGLSTGRSDAVEELTRLLAARGILAGVSLTTACLSGVEHVISHMLDMHQAAHRLPIGLHGAQVGVGSILAATMWNRALADERFVPEQLRMPDPDVAECQIRQAFGHLDDTGALAEECWSDYQKKLKGIADNWSHIEAMLATWKTHADIFRGMVKTGEELQTALVSSGAPATYDTLHQPFQQTTVRWAIHNCHLMRNRFNLVDLLNLLGLWDMETVDSLTGLVSAADMETPSGGTD